MHADEIIVFPSWCFRRQERRRRERNEKKGWGQYDEDGQRSRLLLARYVV
jgi:hypothetical protein